jgi:uncharacterized protein YjbI with pentapeptide repeats
MSAKDLTSPPLASGTVLFRDGTGNVHVTVIVKATYALKPGAVAVPAPPLPLTEDTPRDGVPSNSLYAASDFAPYKLRADVVVVGRIHPRSPTTVRQVVGFALARGPDVLLTKRLVAIGDRARPDAEPSRLSEMPLCWERTWGGPTSRDNPVGCGFSDGAARAPNLVDPEAPRGPVGLGPIAASWPVRASLLSKEHAASLLTAPLTLADDFDLRFFQTAPPDQQLPRLLGGEQLLLIGLHPQHAATVCRLPALHAFARLEGPTKRVRDVPLVGDTLWIDADRSLASLTFRGSVKVATPTEAVALLRMTDTWIVHAGMAPCVDVEEVTGAPRAWSLPSSAAAATSVDERRSPTVEPIAIHDESGFSVGSFAWSFDPPKSRRIVVVKGTFTLAPEGGKPSISPEQDCLRGDEPAGEGADAELVASSDYVPFKAKTDVLLRGTAHAASGRTTARVGVTLGSLAVQLVAIGPRRWNGSGIPGAPGPFEPVPLRWRNAFGGSGFAMNPVGMGLAATTSPPLLEDPEHLIRSRSDRPSPACFAPIAPTWPGRLALLGSFDRAWQRERWPYLPADCDTAFFQAAPARLRCDELHGDESFVLDSVRPGGKNFSGALPGVRPRAFALRRGGAPFEVLLRLDTVLFDTDAERLYLTWRGSFEADDAVSPEIERLVVLRESVDEPRSTADIAAYLAALGEPRLAPQKKENGAASSAGSETPPKDSSVRLADHLRGGTAVLAAAGIFAARVARAAGAPPAPPPLPAPPTRAQVEALVRDGQSLRGRDFSGADLEGVDLSQQDLERVIFARAKLGGANFKGAKLATAKLAGIDAPASIWEGADLSRADLTGAKLVRAVFSRARLEHTSLAGADLTEARLDEIRAESADFSRAVFTSGHAEGAILTKADLSYATLASASFRRARLDDAKLHEVTARGAIFDEASLLDARFEKANLAESSFHDAKAAGAVWECADLSGATLHGADVSGAIFAGARLLRADLGGMLARKSTFRSADLTQAVLDGSDLMQASFEGACLLGTSLRGTNLYQAEVHQAKLEGADLSKAQIAGTKLAR